jgi:hypothetical protein
MITIFGDFRQFLAKKIGVFLKNHCYDHICFIIYHNLAISTQKRQFFLQFFWQKYLKIITSVPGLWMPHLSRHISTTYLCGDWFGKVWHKKRAGIWTHEHLDQEVSRVALKGYHNLKHGVRALWKKEGSMLKIIILANFAKFRRFYPIFGNFQQF